MLTRNEAIDRTIYIKDDLCIFCLVYGFSLFSTSFSQSERKCLINVVFDTTFVYLANDAIQHNPGIQANIKAIKWNEQWRNVNEKF